MSWKFFVVGLLVAAGGYYVVTKRKQSGDTMSFSDYCHGCENAATQELSEQTNVVKTILVLAKTSDSKVAPYLYRRHSDGKVMKKRINYKTYSFEKCPDAVKEAISKGEYIIKRY